MSRVSPVTPTPPCHGELSIGFSLWLMFPNKRPLRARPPPRGGIFPEPGTGPAPATGPASKQEAGKPCKWREARRAGSARVLCPLGWCQPGLPEAVTQPRQRSREVSKPGSTAAARSARPRQGPSAQRQAGAGLRGPRALRTRFHISVKLFLTNSVLLSAHTRDLSTPRSRSRFIQKTCWKLLPCAASREGPHNACGS